MVADEKLRPTTSMSGRARRAENSVMVLPDPGGPHNTASETRHVTQESVQDRTDLIVFVPGSNLVGIRDG